MKQVILLHEDLHSFWQICWFYTTYVRLAVCRHATKIEHFYLNNIQDTIHRSKRILLWKIENKVVWEVHRRSQHHRNHKWTSLQVLIVYLGSLLLNVIFTRNTRLTWCLCIMSICKLCFLSLHCLIWFLVDAPGRFCFSVWWVPWARTKPVANVHLRLLWCCDRQYTFLSTDVVFSFSLELL